MDIDSLVLSNTEGMGNGTDHQDVKSKAVVCVGVPVELIGRRCVAAPMLHERSELTKIIVVDRASVPLIAGPTAAFDSVSHLLMCFFQMTLGHMNLFYLL